MEFYTLYILVISVLRLTTSQESAPQYLQNTVRDLRKLSYKQTLRRGDTKILSESMETSTNPTKIEHRVHYSSNSVPPLSLTKGELAALYESAVAKGETIKFNTGDQSFVHAAVAELDGSESHHHPHPPPDHQYDHKDHHYDHKDHHYEHKDHDHHNDDHPPDDNHSGYYYYYYPIKSFLDEMSSQPSESGHHYSYFPHSHHNAEVPKPTTEKPKYQYHSHHHQHDVKITKVKQAEDNKKPKPMEPLFMVMSTAIATILTIVASAIFMPKFGKKFNILSDKSEEKQDRLSDIARIALNAIEGEDCSERFACELEKTARSMSLYDNRFVKLLKRMAPNSFGKQMTKYTNKKLRCTAVPCRKKVSKKNSNKNDQKKNVQNKKKRS